MDEKLDVLGCLSALAGSLGDGVAGRMGVEQADNDRDLVEQVRQQLLAPALLLD